MKIEFIDINLLKPHEEVKEKKAANFSKYAQRKKQLRTKPILIDRETNVILDGHHRWHVCKELGCKKIPCCTVDYLNDSSIHVVPRKDDFPVSKKEVIRRGVTGDLYPPKSTKHEFDIPAMKKLVNLKEFR